MELEHLICVYANKDAKIASNRISNLTFQLIITPKILKSPALGISRSVAL